MIVALMMIFTGCAISLPPVVACVMLVCARPAVNATRPAVGEVLVARNERGVAEHGDDHNAAEDFHCLCFTSPDRGTLRRLRRARGRRPVSDVVGVCR